MNAAIMEVPSADPIRMAPEESAAVREAIADVVGDGPWIGGGHVEQFEARFSASSGIAHVVGTANGTDALALAMTALELPRGSHILVAANDGGYSAVAARMVGLIPVVMDVADLTMAPTAELAELAWTPAVSAIVVTHLHGDPVALAELDAWRRRCGILLIEDCAQAHGAVLDGRQVGTTGDAAAFSFYPTKNLGAVGDAGAVGFPDPAIADRARALGRYGWGRRFQVELAGGRNSRLDSLQAAVLSARLPWLAARNSRRRDISARYRAAVAGSGMRFSGRADATVAHHAVLVTDDRDGVADRMAAVGVDTAIHYPFLVQDMPGLHIARVSTPNAVRLRDRILTLPCFPELTDDEIQRVVNVLRVEAGRR